MFLELLLVGAVLSQLLGWLFILPLALGMLAKLRFQQYLTADYLRTRLPQLLAAARVQPIEFVLWMIGYAGAGAATKQSASQQQLQGDALFAPYVPLPPPAEAWNQQA